MVYRARVAVTFTSYATKCLTVIDGQFRHKEASEAMDRMVAKAKMEKMVKMEPQNGLNQISIQNFQLCQNGLAVPQVQP